MPTAATEPSTLSRKSAPNASAAEISAEEELDAGYAALETGDLTAGVARFRAALKLEPDNARAAEALAEALEASGQPAEAAETLRATLELRPDSRSLRRRFAGLLAGCGRDGEAESQWRELLLLDSRDEEVIVGLAATLIRRGALPDGIDLLQRALRLRPDNADAQFRLGHAWAELGETGKAEEAFARYLALEPDDPAAARAALAKLDPDRLTPAYVRTLFDQYANNFDRDLVTRLNYRAPDLLRDAVLETLDTTSRLEDVLDLGCGTGLSGAAFRDIADRLHGVDLSPGMVEKARERGIYDALSVGDAVEFLTRVPSAYDLIVAADVVVYLGDLAGLFCAAATALRQGGAFAFTVERLEVEGYRLGPKRRFAHSEDYVGRVAADDGFDPLLVRAAALRTEAGSDVGGLVFVLGKPGAAVG